MHCASGARCLRSQLAVAVIPPLGQTRSAPDSRSARAYAEKKRSAREQTNHFLRVCVELSFQARSNSVYMRVCVLLYIVT